MIKTCEICGKEYHTFPSLNQRFCSRKCQGVWRSRQTGPKAANWQGGKVTLACEQCGKQFEVKPYDARNGRRFCSQRCAGMAHTHRCEWVCRTCGKTFTAPVSQGERVYCSKECQGIAFREADNPNWRGGLSIECAMCGEVVWRGPCQLENRQRVFCSQDCMNAYYTGENAPQWNGGSSYEPYPVTFNAAFKKKIRQRDGHQCAICRLPAKCVHHVNYVKDDTDPTNCITLCKACHGVTNHNRDYWQAALSKLLQARTIGAAYG